MKKDIERLDQEGMSGFRIIIARKIQGTLDFVKGGFRVRGKSKLHEKRPK